MYVYCMLRYQVLPSRARQPRPRLYRVPLDGYVTERSSLARYLINYQLSSPSNPHSPLSSHTPIARCRPSQPLADGWSQLLPSHRLAVMAMAAPPSLLAHINPLSARRRSPRPRPQSTEPPHRPHTGSSRTRDPSPISPSSRSRPV